MNGNNNKALFYMTLSKLQNDYNQLVSQVPVRTITQLAIIIAVLLMAPITTLVILDFLLYIYRVCLKSMIAAVTGRSSVVGAQKLDETKINLHQRSKRNIKKIARSNSYFNFNNYIQMTKHSFTPMDRKNSTDSLNSNDSVIDLTTHLNQNKSVVEQGKVYLRGRHDNNTNVQSDMQSKILKSDNYYAQNQRNNLSPKSGSFVFSLSN